jgi:hypothetical protein
MSGEYLDEEMKEHEANMKAIREKQEAEQKATIEKHKAAYEAAYEAGTSTG